MISFLHYSCTKKGCKQKIGQKTHEWCQRKGVPDLCFDHQIIVDTNKFKGVETK